MSVAMVFSRANIGIDAPLVTVETHLSNGLPRFDIVGLPETAVKESKERVRSAIINSVLDFPAMRITINLAPADLPKSSARFDLAIAISILAASGQIPSEPLDQYEFLGELALTGALRVVESVLPAVIASYKTQRRLILPRENCLEAGLIQDAQSLQAETLLDVCSQFLDEKPLAACKYNNNVKGRRSGLSTADINDIRGQHLAKRAIQIAASGSHNLLFVGPPGTGKTMMANCMTSLLPDLNEEDALEVASVKSISKQKIHSDFWLEPPFRAPHHTASSAAIAGGGSNANPGEVTLAHRGVLFLDEWAEFNRNVLEILREPLECGSIFISRANYRVRYPANFQLVAAMNPCPCGYYGDPTGNCNCTKEKIDRYLSKISGPLMDRIDLYIHVPRPSPEEIMLQPYNKRVAGNGTIRQHISQCRDIQIKRCQKRNSDLTTREISKYCELDKNSKNLLKRAMEKLAISARGYHRILRIARTIADFEQHENIEYADLSEAIGYRRIERRNEGLVEKNF